MTLFITSTHNDSGSVNGNFCFCLSLTLSCISFTGRSSGVFYSYHAAFRSLPMDYARPCAVLGAIGVRGMNGEGLTMVELRRYKKGVGVSSVRFVIPDVVAVAAIGP